MPRYDVISKPEALQAVGRPADDVSQRSNGGRAPQKPTEAKLDETAEVPAGGLAAIIMSGLGDEGLIGIAEQFYEARIRIKLTLSYYPLPTTYDLLLTPYYSLPLLTAYDDQRRK